MDGKGMGCCGERDCCDWQGGMRFAWLRQCQLPGFVGEFRTLSKFARLVMLVPQTHQFGDVAKLADALDLGSSSFTECRFDSCHPHSSGLDDEPVCFRWHFL